MSNIKKSILALSMSVAMIGGFNAFAGTKENSNQQCQPCPTEQCVQDSCCQGGQRFAKGGKGCVKGDKQRKGGKGGSKGQRPGGKETGLKQAFTGIELTPVQKDSVKQILQRERTAVKQGVRSLRQQARANTEKQIEQILTPEQFKQFQANEAQMQQKMQQKRQDKAQGTRKGSKGPKAHKGQKDRK